MKKESMDRLYMNSVPKLMRKKTMVVRGLAWRMIRRKAELEPKGTKKWSSVHYNKDHTVKLNNKKTRIKKKKEN